jgi:hypothetical protein
VVGVGLLHGVDGAVVVGAECEGMFFVVDVNAGAIEGVVGSAQLGGAEGLEIDVGEGVAVVRDVGFGLAVEQSGVEVPGSYERIGVGRVFALPGVALVEIDRGSDDGEEEDGGGGYCLDA